MRVIQRAGLRFLIILRKMADAIAPTDSRLRGRTIGEIYSVVLDDAALALAREGASSGWAAQYRYTERVRRPLTAFRTTTIRRVAKLSNGGDFGVCASVLVHRSFGRLYVGLRNARSAQPPFTPLELESH